MRDINWKHEILDFIKTLGISFIIIFIVTQFIIRPIRVNQNSMYPTLYDQSFGITNVFSAKIGDINRFDVVVIKLPNNTHLVKRVIGLPNETISYKNDQLFVDGVAIEENFINEEYRQEIISKYGTFTEPVEEIILGDDEVFCLGDNRPYSKDSRAYGPFKKSQIVSKGVVIVYPFNQIKIVK